MRFKSPKSSSYQVFAVSGVNTISFGIQAGEKARRGLLGFAVERIDPTENERYIMPGFKVFRSVIPNPNPDTVVSTWEHPVQSFVWDDFTAKPNREYEYLFYPIKGTPKNLDRSTKPVRIRVRTEPLYSKGTHDIFFNRGVASSQAYRRRFGNLKPDEQPTKEKQKEALQWLTRDLDEAILRFIKGAKKGDTLLGCFYEFRYEPVARELKAAIDRGVDVRLIIDAKVNEHMENGKLVESFPREENLRMLKTAGIPKKNVTLRQAKPSNIQHNKFMVLVRHGDKPEEVWTGSTNISLGGFSGQTNVGHWVRDPETARQFVAYWELLKTDPGAVAGLERSEAQKANRALHAAVAALHEAPTAIDAIPPGTTAVFSPRAGREVLDLYVRLVDSAKACSCITLAFGINESFKEQLLNNTSLSHVVFMLLEKRDRANPRSTKPFVPLTAANNVYQAWGAFIKDPVYQWARETNAGLLKVNAHVVYVHSKFLLMDPLGDDPIVVTGSANFSKASTNDNDENMLLIRGEQRVADIYFTEFNRLFNHYYFRSVTEALKERRPTGNSQESLFLAEEDEKWLVKYAPGKLRTKRLQLYMKMEGAKTL
ncbi:MAG TPA: phospholipase D-like domain-containing protein [Thermoanaerobaculia bacterium]|jgi:phosphatidylserine/phosphatidylglycerophosphate/cardiolipin synthase-like enzyme